MEADKIRIVGYSERAVSHWCCHEAGVKWNSLSRSQKVVYDMLMTATSIWRLPSVKMTLTSVEET